MERVLAGYERLNALVWDEKIWFPPGVNWTTLKSTDNEKYPDFGDMYYPIAYAFVILLIRTVFEWSIARPLGRLCGIVDTGSELPNFFKRLYTRTLALFGANKSSAQKPVKNGTLSNGTSNHHLHRNGVNHRVVANGTSSHQPARPQRRRKRLIVPKSKLDKFSESCWRCLYYFCIFVFGIYTLWDKPWFWDTAHCWYGYPFQTIDNDVWWLYMVEASFYWSLTISQFVDVHRKDFGMNFVHHVATIALLWFSWADNFVRMGTIVLVVHDAADSWLEGAKMARYSNHGSVCNALFAVFLLVWMVTRLGLYPFRIIYSTLIEAPSLVGFYAAYYVFNTLLIVLQVLHILWSIMIFKIAANALTTHEADDVRSDDEDSDAEEVEEDESSDSEEEKTK